MHGVRWLIEDCEGYCLLLARGLEISQFVARLGGDPSSIFPSMDPSKAFEKSMDESPIARLGTCGEWVYSLEHWSVEGIDNDVMARVSEGTECVAVLNSGTPPVWLAHSVNGQSVAYFEPVMADQVAEEAVESQYASHRVATDLADAGVGSGTFEGNSEELLLRLVERNFGIDLSNAQLDQNYFPAVSLDLA
ncbi:MULTISPECIES: DUF6461 domain-containing protein [unclassified Streptomyces]|uniref:DUF6461 domain-containing protein n=1 Tax=unclassified Streptomyces TaxID=2593676 RepID=UPI0033B7C829